MTSRNDARLLLICLFATALTGCGRTGGSGSMVAPNPYTFSGSWGSHIDFTINSTTVPVIEFLGTLSSAGGAVSGGLTPIPTVTVGTPCMAPSLTPLPVTGTVDSSGNLVITLPLGGGTAMLTAALSTDPETEAAGSYKIVGGTCAMSATPMQIAQYAPLNGIYTGTLHLLNSSGVPISGTSTAITAELMQSATPNANGQFPVTGTVTATGACTANLTLTNGSVWGGTLLSEDTTFSYNLGAAFDPTGTIAQSALLEVHTTSAGCPYNMQIFEGTLTRQ